MKQIISYLVIMLAAALLFFTACKGNTGQTGGAQADSGQTHVGNSGPADSAGYKVSPTETGGKDTTSDGNSSNGMPKDTPKTQP
jgi:hypothetical protein